MAFRKTGDAEIEAVFCSCGGKIDPNTGKCTVCGKEQISTLAKPKDPTKK